MILYRDLRLLRGGHLRKQIWEAPQASESSRRAGRSRMCKMENKIRVFAVSSKSHIPITALSRVALDDGTDETRVGSGVGFG